MHLNGIKTCYSGALGEIRYSSFSKLKDSDFAASPSLSFKYVLKGQENYVMDGKRFTIQKGQALFFREDKPYKGFIDHPVTQGLCIDLNLGMVNFAEMDFLNENQVFLLNPEFNSQRITFLDHQVHCLLQQIAENNTQNQTLQYEESLQELFLLILKMEKEFVEKIKDIPVRKESYRREIFKRLLDSKNYIRDCYAQNIQLKDISRACGFSQFHFHRLFKKIFGQTPSEYLEKIRMTEAKKRLNYLSVTETCIAVGFSDTAYFSRRFKKFYGVSPRDYHK